MMKRLAIYMSILIIAFTVAACGKKEEKKAETKAQIPAQQGQEGAYTGPGVPGPGMTQGSATDPHGTGSAGKEAVVSVPDFVKGKWRGVVLTIEDKKNNKKKDYEVKLNSEFTIPDSNIVIKTGEFFPSFTMDDKAYTSRSNNPENPGINLTVMENGKEIFKGWVFSKFPTMHPFMHNRFGITLKEGVKAS
ncbi:MAG: DUF2155 domain-containing protein [Nitrospirae bacterium]|nr:DUF2155 domain-containing protein [Nitrospirota bacterium]